MLRPGLTLPALLAAGVLALAGCGGDDDGGEDAAEAGDTAAETTSGSGGGGEIHGTVGPGFDISVEDADGLSAGTYTLVVDDKSADHNFHLTGPGGVDVSTEVGEEGEESFEVTLEAGEYTFVCDPHASGMRGTFTVG